MHNYGASISCRGTDFGLAPLWHNALRAETRLARLVLIVAHTNPAHRPQAVAPPAQRNNASSHQE